MKALRKTGIFLLVIIPLLIIVAFLLSPWIIKTVLQQQLPAQFSLEKFDMEYPAWNQLDFNEIELVQKGDVTNSTIEVDGSEISRINSLNIRHLSIQAEWPWTRIDKLSIEAVNGQINFMPTFATESTEDSVDQGDTILDAASLPEIIIQTFNIQLFNQSSAPLTLKGSLSNLQSLATLVLDLSSSAQIPQSSKANLTLLTKDKVNFSLDSTFLLTLNEWESLQFDQQRLPVLPIQISDGAINLKLQSEFSYAQSLLKINQLNAAIEVANTLMKNQVVELSQINSRFDTECKDDQCVFSPFSISGTGKLLNPQERLVKSEFPFQIVIDKLQLEKQLMNIKGKLLVEQQQLSFESSANQLNDQWLFDADLFLKLKNIGENYYSDLNGLNVNNLQGNVKISATLQNDILQIKPPRTKNVILKGVQIKQPYLLNIDEAKVKLRFKKDFLEAAIPVDEIYLVANSIQLDIPEYTSESHSQLALDIKEQKDQLSFSGSLLRTNSVAKTGKSLILSDSTFSGGFNKKSNMLDAQVDTVFEVSNIKPMLKTLVKNNKLIDKLKIQGSVQSDVKDSVIAKGSFSLKLPKDGDLQLKGTLHSEIAKIEMANNRLENFTTNIEWLSDQQDFQPWSKFAVDLQAKINFQKIDQQTHHLTGKITVAEEILFEKIQLKSQLLGGELVANANQEAKPFNDIDGELILTNLDLQKINRLLEKKELKMSGQLSGKIGFFMQERNLRFKAGEFKSTAGIIEYLPEGNKKVLTQDNISDIASITLQNFNYQVLKAEVLSGGPCGFDIKFRLEGRNPDLGSTKDQIFNINYAPISNVNLYYLLLLGEDSIKHLNQEQLHSGCVNSQ